MKSLGLFILLVFMWSSAGAQMRLWTDANGERFEAEFQKSLFGTVYLKAKEGSEVRLNLETMQPEDVEFLRLHVPPEMEVDVTRSSSVKPRHPKVLSTDVIDLPKISVSIEQKSDYKFDGTVVAEVYIIGDEVSPVYPGVYRLLAKKTERFSFTNAVRNVYSHRFETTTEARRFKAEDGRDWGVEYAGYVVVLRDEKGRLLSFVSSLGWVKENNLAALQGFRVFNFFDEKLTKLPVPRPVDLDDESNWSARF